MSTSSLRNSAIGYMCASFQMSTFLTCSFLYSCNMRISVVCNILCAQHKNWVQCTLSQPDWTLGALQRKQKSEITMEVGGWWVLGPRLNVFRACLGAQKWRNFVLFSTASLRFVLSRVFFFYSLGPRRHSDFFGIFSKSPKPVLIFWSSIPCEFCPYIAKSCWLLWFKCSVHVKWWVCKKNWWVGGVSSIQVFWEVFNFAKPHTGTFNIYCIGSVAVGEREHPCCGRAHPGEHAQLVHRGRGWLVSIDPARSGHRSRRWGGGPSSGPGQRLGRWCGHWRLVQVDVIHRALALEHSKVTLLGHWSGRVMASPSGKPICE